MQVPLSRQLQRPKALVVRPGLYRPGPQSHCIRLLIQTTRTPWASAAKAISEEQAANTSALPPAPSTSLSPPLPPSLDTALLTSTITERGQSATPALPSAFNNLSQQKPSSAARFIEAQICRLYYFSEKELDTVKGLVSSMRNCRAAVSALAVASILLTIITAGEHGNSDMSAEVITASGLTIGDVAFWADSFMIAALISYSIGPFESVCKSRSNQMAYTFQGINRLSLVFQQLSIGSVAVSTITGLEAAAKYPPLVVGMAIMFFGVAVVRSAAMWWTITRHARNNEEVSRTLRAMRDPDDPSCGEQMGLLDKWAVFLAFGYLIEYEATMPKPAMAAASSQGMTMAAVDSGSTGSAQAVCVKDSGQPGDCQKCGNPGYEFSQAEERVLRGLTEAASTTGLALGLQAFITLMLTVADVGVNDVPDAVSNGITAINKFVMAAILFNACASYDRALHTADCNDVEHLMKGLGHNGLTGLFDALAVLSWAVTIATLAGLALPMIEENVVARMVGDGLSHRAADVVIEALEYGVRLLRGM